MHGACGGTRIRRDNDAHVCTRRSTRVYVTLLRRDVQVTWIPIVLFMTIPAPFPVLKTRRVTCVSRGESSFERKRINKWAAGGQGWERDNSSPSPFSLSSLFGPRPVFFDSSINIPLSSHVSLSTEARINYFVSRIRDHLAYSFRDRRILLLLFVKKFLFWKGGLLFLILNC